MGKKPETRLVNQILKSLRQHGGWWFKVHGSPMQVSGIPDILGCYEGRFIALEAKMPDGKLSARQELIMQRINDAGGIALTVTNPEHAMGLINELDKEIHDRHDD